VTLVMSTTFTKPSLPRLSLVAVAVTAVITAVTEHVVHDVPHLFALKPKVVVEDVFPLVSSTKITIKNVGWVPAQSAIISLWTLSNKHKYGRFSDYDGRCKPYPVISDIRHMTFQCEMLNPGETVRFLLDTIDFGELSVKTVTDGRSSPIFVYGYNGKPRELP
jgi:hypothetical protein